jgi:hypothetical protein
LATAAHLGSPPAAQTPQPSTAQLKISYRFIALKVVQEDIVFVFLAWTPRDAVIVFAGHVLVADMDEPRMPTTTPEPRRTPLTSAARPCAKIHAPIPCQCRRVSEPTTAVVPSFPTIPRPIKSPGGPP